MAYYRLYFIDGGTGHIERFHEFEADDDDAAIASSDELRGGQRAELWSGGRKVKRWNSGDAA